LYGESTWVEACNESIPLVSWTDYLDSENL
jgi:hypothetical protein